MAQTAGKAGKVVLFASGKGGVGKSSLAAGCGYALAQRGRKTLLVDADSGLRAQDLLLGVADRTVFDVGDVLAGRCEPGRAIIETSYPGLHLLPAMLEGEPEAEAFRELLRGLAHFYGFVLVDAPAGVGAGVKAPAGAADTAVLVTTPEPVAVRDAGRAAQILRAQGVPELRLVINRVEPRLIRKKVLPNLDDVIDAAAVRLLGAVPEDKQVVAAAVLGRPVSLLRHGAGQAVRNIAARLDGEEVPLMKL